MILFLGWLVFLAAGLGALILAALGNRQFRQAVRLADDDEVARGIAFGLWAAICFGASGLMLIAGSVHIVQPGEVAVPISMFGHSETALESGFHFTRPFTIPRYLSIRQETDWMTTSADNRIESGGGTMAVNASEGKSANIDISVTTRPSSERSGAGDNKNESGGGTVAVTTGEGKSASSTQ